MFSTSLLRALFILLIPMLVTSMSSNQIIVYTIESGVGTEKLQINSSIDSVIEIFGKPDHIKESIACGDSKTLYISRHIFEASGITIISHRFQNRGELIIDGLISNIIFTKPQYVSSINNTSFNASSKEFVISAFGQPEYKKKSRFNSVYFTYREKGISFEIDNETDKVLSIEVYANNGYPSYE